jgi:two-component system, NtrC family, response regulator AtoC
LEGSFTHKIESLPPAAPATNHVSLLFIWSENLRAVALREGQSLVVGRSAPADFVIHDGSLSRAHARLSLDGGRMTIQDLASTNGCFVNGTRVTNATVGEQDVVRLAAIELRLGSLTLAQEPKSALPHATFMRTLADELARARVTGRCTSVLALRQDLRTGIHEALEAALRPFDRWCAYAPNLDLVLLPERDPTSARHWLSEAPLPGKEHLRAGLASYPTLACSAEKLVSRALDACHAAKQGSVEETVSLPQRSGDGPLVRSPAMLRLYDLVARAAGTPLPVLVHGETGSGKELVARAIHDKSPRRAAPFKPLNCATIPATLLESVLFGHERGAFTGADRQVPGVFEQARGGTVFLDEVAELSPQAQAALLRVFEQHRIVRVGGTKEIAVDARIVAATHRNLSAMVSAGTFREDLMFRLDALTLRVPPLRDRREEILPLARLFMARAREQWSASASELSDEVCEALTSYRWPGNVRQLKNVIERAIVVCAGTAIGLEDLPDEVWLESAPSCDHAAGAEPAGSVGGSPRSLPARVREFEIAIIEDALARAGGNQAQAARLLGMPRRTLASKAQVLGLVVKEQR